MNRLSGVFSSAMDAILSLRDVTTDFAFSLGTRHILIGHSLLFYLAGSSPTILKAFCSISNAPGQTLHLVFVGKVVGNGVEKDNSFQ